MTGRTSTTRSSSPARGARIQVTPAIDIDVGRRLPARHWHGPAAGEVKSTASIRARPPAASTWRCRLGFRVTSMIGVRAGVDFRQFGMATGFGPATRAIPAGAGSIATSRAWGGLEVWCWTAWAVGAGGGGEEEAPPAKKPPAKAKKPPTEAEPRGGQRPKEVADRYGCCAARRRPRNLADMAIKRDHGVRCRDAMKGLFWGWGLRWRWRRWRATRQPASRMTAPLSRSASAGATRRHDAGEGEEASAARRAAGPGRRSRRRRRGGRRRRPEQRARRERDSSDEAERSGAVRSIQGEEEAGRVADGIGGRREQRVARRRDQGAPQDRWTRPWRRRRPRNRATASPASALEFGLGAKALFRQLAWTADARGRRAGAVFAVARPADRGLARVLSGRVRVIGLRRQHRLYRPLQLRLRRRHDARERRRGRDQVPGFPGRAEAPGSVRHVHPERVDRPTASRRSQIAQQRTHARIFPTSTTSSCGSAPGTRMMFTPAVALDVGAAYLLVLDPGSGADSDQGPRQFFPTRRRSASTCGVRRVPADQLIGARAGIDLRACTHDVQSRRPTPRGHRRGRSLPHALPAWRSCSTARARRPRGDDDEPAKPSKRKKAPKPTTKKKSEDESKSEDE